MSTFSSKPPLHETGQPVEATESLSRLSLRIDGGWHRLSRLLMVVYAIVCITGCSLGIMASKMFFGDPMLPSEFEKYTHVDLGDSPDELLILCTAPHVVQSEVGSLSLDIIDGITRRLKRREVNVIDPDDVAGWLDDRGGQVTDDELGQLGADFGAEFVALIKIEQFSHFEENSTDLLRGRANGSIHVYRIEDVDGLSVAQEVYTSEFESVYPGNHPRSVQQVSDKVFLKAYVDRINDQLARTFHSYRYSETIE